MYQPQQVDVVVQMARAVQDGQLTSMETQRITDAGLAFGLSLILGAVLGVLVRSVLAEALEQKEEKAGASCKKRCRGGFLSAGGYDGLL